MMNDQTILRIWYAWTTAEKADAFESLWKNTVAPSIRARTITGFCDIQLGRRAAGNEVEFVVVTRFDNLDAVKTFAGEDYEISVVPDAARALLARYEERAAHYARVGKEPG